MFSLQNCMLLVSEICVQPTDKQLNILIAIINFFQNDFR